MPHRNMLDNSPNRLRIGITGRLQLIKRLCSNRIGFTFLATSLILPMAHVLATSEVTESGYSAKCSISRLACEKSLGTDRNRLALSWSLKWIGFIVNPQVKVVKPTKGCYSINSNANILRVGGSCICRPRLGSKRTEKPALPSGLFFV